MLFIEPTMAYAQQISAYRQAFVESGESMDGTGALMRLVQPQAWLDRNALFTNPATVPEGLVLATQYIYVRESDRKIVGMLQIRHSFNPFLEKYGGNIGYSVAPDERRKGYATQMLFLALEKCRELGMQKVLVTCLQDNEASRRTILRHGGVYESTVFEPKEGVYLQRYWISLNK